MKAWRLHEFGGIQAMRLDEMERPQPGPGEVLVRVRAAAANPFDWYMAEGLLSMFKVRLPAIVGRDGAGEVVAIGAGVTGFKPGDAVYGQADPESDGTFTEFAILRADRLMRKPETLPFTHAAALPNAIYAAWDALFSKTTGMNLQAGQTVLIHGAGGGIGTLTVQLAKWRGARVIAVASSRHEALMRELGADEFIDYTQKRFEAVVGRRVDGVVDTICAEPESKSYAVLVPGGVYVSLLKTPDEAVARAAGVRAVLAYGMSSYGATADIEAVVAAGVIRPIVSKVLAMSQAPDALVQLKSGHVQGKIVIGIDE